jgi:hypothetical protein
VRAGFHVAVNIPDDTFQSVDGPTLPHITAYEAARGNRVIDLYGDAAISGASLSFFHRCGTNPCVGSDDNQSTDIAYTLTYTSTSANILVEMAGHLAITCADSSSPCASNPDAWPNPKGSSNISGGPYHFHYEGFDGDGGSQDNQIQGAEITGTPQIDTQCYANGVVCPPGLTLPGTSATVSDTVTITGTGTAAITGTVTFYLCRTTSINIADVPNCIGDATRQVGAPVLITQGVAPVGTAKSINVFVNSFRAYCWGVTFQTADPIHNGNTQEFDNVVPTKECFILGTPTAVTVSSLNAEDASGPNLAMLLLGGVGVVVLGGLIVVAFRKR